MQAAVDERESRFCFYCKQKPIKKKREDEGDKSSGKVRHEALVLLIRSQQEEEEGEEDLRATRNVVGH